MNPHAPAIPLTHLLRAKLLFVLLLLLDPARLFARADDARHLTFPKSHHPFTKLAPHSQRRLIYFSAALLILFTFILASRSSARVKQVWTQLKPSSSLRPPWSYWNSPTSSTDDPFYPGFRKPVTTSTMASGQFRSPPQAPPLFTASAESIITDAKKLIDKSRTIQDSVANDVADADSNFQSVMLPMAHDENYMSWEAHVLGFYQAVSMSKELRDASTDADKMFEDFSIESAMREDVFRKVDCALKAEEPLDPESKRLLEKDHKSYVRNGLGIPAGPQRDRFKEIKKRLSDISITFQKRLNEENGGLWFTREELEGVPQDLIDNFEPGAGANDGKLRVTFKYPDLFPVSKYATNADVRRQLFVANENKCNDNVPLFKETVELRDEAARLLGYPNHAAFRIEDKMAKTPAWVNNFLEDLRKRLAPGGAQELKKLQQLKSSDLDDRGLDSDGKYYLWDHRFYDTMMLEKEYQLDQEKVSQWFPLSSTITGMLHIFEQLFGLQFVEVVGKDRDHIASTGKGDDIVWHKDVQIFSVWDDGAQGDGFVGYLYLDLHPRQGKYGHAANFNLQPGFIDRHGKRRYPATALVCNFSKPTPSRPSLLKHDEVVTLFHELGHGIHDLVAKTTYSRFHGTNTVRDFVEAPSQMLENWCWTPSQLRALSKHWSYLSPQYEMMFKENNTESEQPPEIIPDDLIDSIIKTKHVNDALANLRQLHFGTFDMRVHEPASHSAIKELPISEAYNKMRRDISGLEGPEALGEGYEWGHGEATFGHLIGGYDAGYYGYLSSQVYSSDMFYSKFKKDPMNGDEGRRYRHTVLERGGSQDEMETLKAFLGREPSTEAFYKELGLA